MKQRLAAAFVALLFFPTVALITSAAPAQDAPFSGPQKGEKLSSFPMKGVYGDKAGKEVDLMKETGDKPVVLIFVHKRTRPAFGLMNSVMKYVATRSKDGLVGGVVFLTDDVTETSEWMTRVKQHVTEGVTYGVSTDGADGPGAYGLNRNVTLTVVVGKDGKAVDNYALVQPSIQADGPKILKSVVGMIGGEAPTAADLTRRQPNMDARMNDPALQRLLRSVINKQASPDDVKAAVAKVDAYLEKNEEARKVIGRIASTIVNSDRLNNYGTPPAQEALRQWNTKYGKLAPVRPNTRPNAKNAKDAKKRPRDAAKKREPEKKKVEEQNP